MGCVYWDERTKDGRVVRPGCWALRFKDVNGSQKHRRTGFTSKTDYDRAKAERALQDIEDSVDRAARRGLASVAEANKDPSPITLQKAAQEYVDAQENLHTKENYQSIVNLHILKIIGNVPLASMKTADIILLIEARQKLGASVG